MITVLYVDDEEGLLGLGKIFLERMGNFVVEITDSPLKAIELIGSSRYDAIISDYEMPGMNGIDLLKEVRKRYGDLPFILFTGRGREEVVIQAINNGADFYLQKGGDPKSQFAELEHKVTQAVLKRQAELSLEISNENLRIASFRHKALIAASNTGAWEYNSNTGHFWCSPEFFSMLGQDINDFPDLNVLDINQIWGENLHPADREKVVRTWETYLQNPVGMYEQVFQMHHQNGDWIWVLSRGRMLVDSTGKSTGIVVGAHIDVTYQKQVEEELVRKNQELQSAYEKISANEEILRLNIQELTRREQELQDSKQELSDIIEFLPDATYVIDMNGVVVAWNRAIEEMTGVMKESIIGKGDRIYTIPFYGFRRKNLIDLMDLDEEEIRSTYRYVQRKGNTLYAEFTIPDFNKEKNVSLWATASPLFNKLGNRIGAIESIRDITELRKYIEGVTSQSSGSPI